MSSEAIENKSNKRIKLGTLLGCISFIINVLTSVFVTRVALSHYGKGLYGVAMLASSLISLFSFDFGIGTITNKFISAEIAKNDSQKKERINSFCGLIIEIFCLFDIFLAIICIGVYFGAEFLYPALSNEELVLFRRCFLIAAGFALLSFPTTPFDGVLQAYEEFPIIKSYEILQKIVFASLSLAFIYFDLDIAFYLLAMSFGGLTCVIIKSIVFFHKCKIRPIFFSKSINKAYLKTISAFSLWAITIATLSRIQSSLTPSIIGGICSSNEISIFNIANSIDTYILALSSIMGSFFFAKLSRVDQEENSFAHMESLASSVGKFQAFFVLLVLLGFACCGEEFILLWMKNDQDFKMSYYGALIMCFYMIFLVPQNIFSTMMYIKNCAKYLAISQIIATVFYISVSYLLGYFFGIVGVFVAIGFSKIIQIIMDSYYYKRKLNVRLTNFFKTVYMKYIVPGLISLGIGMALHTFLPLECLPKFIITGCSVLCSFCTLCYFFAFTKEEKNVFFSLFKRKQKNKLRE